MLEPLYPLPRAVAVVDLGFGDAGKGLITDYLTRKLAATAIVRFNGGAQAGHNVVTPEGRHHTFAQLGAGSFVAGVETWLGPEVIVHPAALLIEATELERKGVRAPLDGVRLHEDAPIVTPLDQGLGRLRELARGQGRHGSCGVGIGEVAADLRRGEPVLRAAHLRDRLALGRHMATLRERRAHELRALQAALPRSPDVQRELGAFEPSALSRWVDLAVEIAARVRVVDAGAWQVGLSRHPTVLFEGAQGVLLDRDHGFFPYTSPGDCTLRAAAALAAGLDAPLFRLGVLRAYSVRHGPGPLPGELQPRPGWAHEAHNSEGPWQGAVRVSYPDLVLMRYALDCVGGVDALAVTHADRVTSEWARIDAYQLDDERLETVPKFAALSLEERAAQTERLFHAVPLTTELRLNPDDPGGDFAKRLASALDTPLALVSKGPTHADVEGHI